MTVAAPARQRRPVFVQVLRSQLVGDLMNAQALLDEALTAASASLQAVLRLPAGPERDEMTIAHHTTHDRIVAALTDLRACTGRYDGVAPAT